MKLRSFAKEFAVVIVAIIIFTNIMSYLRSPELLSNKLPPIEATLLNGNVYRVEKGKPLVLHFWATWCPTCKLEASNIEHISQTYEVLTIVVNSGDDRKIKTYMDQRGLTFRVVNDSQGMWAKQFHVEAYPTTFIYDANGTLKFTEVGYTSTAGLLARLTLIK